VSENGITGSNVASEHGNGFSIVKRFILELEWLDLWTWHCVLISFARSEEPLRVDVVTRIYTSAGRRTFNLRMLQMLIYCHDAGFLWTGREKECCYVHAPRCCFLSLRSQG
jgi:hypothetical protein